MWLEGQARTSVRKQGVLILFGDAARNLDCAEIAALFRAEERRGRNVAEQEAREWGDRTFVPSVVSCSIRRDRLHQPPAGIAGAKISSGLKKRFNSPSALSIESEA